MLSLSTPIDGEAACPRNSTKGRRLSSYERGRTPAADQRTGRARGIAPRSAKRRRAPRPGPRRTCCRLSHIGPRHSGARGKPQQGRHLLYRGYPSAQPPALNLCTYCRPDTPDTSQKCDGNYSQATNQTWNDVRLYVAARLLDLAGRI